MEATASFALQKGEAVSLGQRWQSETMLPCVLCRNSIADILQIFSDGVELEIVCSEIPKSTPNSRR